MDFNIFCNFHNDATDRSQFYIFKNIFVDYDVTANIKNIQQTAQRSANKSSSTTLNQISAANKLIFFLFTFN